MVDFQTFKTCFILLFPTFSFTLKKSKIWPLPSFTNSAMAIFSNAGSKTLTFIKGLEPGHYTSVIIKGRSLEELVKVLVLC